MLSLCSVVSLNKALTADPTNSELMYSVRTRSSYALIPECRTRSVIEFNFNAAPLGSRPTVLYLLFQNTSTVPIEWSSPITPHSHYLILYYSFSFSFSCYSLAFLNKLIYYP